MSDKGVISGDDNEVVARLRAAADQLSHLREDPPIAAVRVGSHRRVLLRRNNSIRAIILCFLLAVVGLGVFVATSQRQSATHLLTPPSDESGYEAAKTQWIGSWLTAGTALQNMPLQLAIADLRRGEATDEGNASGYSASIAAIEDFERIPITGVTASDLEETEKDWSEIADFFALPTMRGGPRCSTPRISTINPAVEQWSSEPAGISSGVRPGPLLAAATDLEAEIGADPGGTTCFPAAIADLESLAPVTRAAIATSGRLESNHCSLVGDEIAYLDAFFDQLGGNDDSDRFGGACGTPTWGPR
jgi:hypothetical protein